MLSTCLRKEGGNRLVEFTRTLRVTQQSLLAAQIASGVFQISLSSSKWVTTHIAQSQVIATTRSTRGEELFELGFVEDGDA